VVDTVGLGDNRLSEEQVLFKIADACWAVREGLHQVFFMYDRRFSAYTAYVYNLLRAVVFNEEICRFTTIVRTDFWEFENRERCEADIRDLRQLPVVGEIVQNCARVLHVQNVPNGQIPGVTVDFQARSRDLLRLHVRNCRELYRPDALNQIKDRITVHMEEKTRIEREKKELEKALEASTNQLQRVQTEMQSIRDNAEHQISTLRAEQRAEEVRLRQMIEEAERKRAADVEAYNRERQRLEEDLKRKQAEVEAEKARAAQQVSQHMHQQASRFVNPPGFWREVERIGQQVGSLFKAFKFW